MGTYSTCTVHTINVLSKKGRGGHIRGGGLKCRRGFPEHCTYMYIKRTLALTFSLKQLPRHSKITRYWSCTHVSFSSNLNAVFSQLIIILNFRILHYHWHDPFQMFSNSVACLATAMQDTLYTQSSEVRYIGSFLKFNFNKLFKDNISHAETYSLSSAQKCDEIL